MKYYLLSATIMVIGLVAPATAQADGSIGIWRWLGMGWGPGYHASSPAHGPTYHSAQPSAPDWQHPWHAPREMNPALEPIPARSTYRPWPYAPASPSYSHNEAGPSFPQKLESARRNYPVR